jgi:hypothetical protein
VATRRFWVCLVAGADPVEMDELSLQRRIAEDRLDPAAVAAVPVGGDAWGTARDFGFSNEVPW